MVSPPTKNKKLRSKGEEHVYQCLLHCGIPASRILHEYQFEGLVGDGGRPLRYDFYISANPTFLCEFDGKNTHEHAQLVRTFGHRNARRRMRHDDAKNQFARDRGIPLLRISYREKNVQATILRFIQKHNVRVEGTPACSRTHQPREEQTQQYAHPRTAIPLMMFVVFGLAYAALRRS